MPKYRTKDDKPTRKVLGMAIATAILLVLGYLFLDFVSFTTGWVHAIAVLVVSITAALINYWVGYTIRPVKKDGVDEVLNKHAAKKGPIK